MKPYLSVIIPTYNEEKRITSTLLDVDKYLEKQDYDYEIIVVDDGSRDKTVKVVKKLRKIVENLKVIKNKKNRGKGAVVKQGMLRARGKYRVFMDADNSVSIGQIENFWPYLKKGYDIVIGSIVLKGSKIEEEAGWHRRLMGTGAKFLIRLIMWWNIHDSQRGFKCFTVAAAKKIFPKQTIKRWGFDIEILAIARLLKYKIKEVPVHWINLGESKVTLSSYLRTLIELVKIKWNLINKKYLN